MPATQLREEHAGNGRRLAPAKGKGDNFHDAIAACAYERWVRRGRPEGTERQDWGEAETVVTQAYISASLQAQRRLVAERAVSRLLVESSQFTTAAPMILRAICESLGWDVGAFWMPDPDTDSLRCTEFWHAPKIDVSAFEEASRSVRFSLGSGLPGRVWASRDPAWVPDVTQDVNFPRSAIAADSGIHGAAAFPVHNGGAILGIMEFFSREIRQPDDGLLEMMLSIGNGIGEFIERRRAESALKCQQQEFTFARQIQEGLQPRSMPVPAGFSIGGRSLPSQTVGGDYFDFFRMIDDTLGIAIGDASGHGIAAALMIVETRAYLRAFAFSSTDPGAILTLTNRRLAEDLDSGRFVTLLLARLDPLTLSLDYVGAGHCPAYVLDGAGQVKATLVSEGRPLGLDPAETFPITLHFQLKRGDLLFLYTDGIVEAGSGGTRGLFGIQRALSVVREHRQQAPDEILEALFRSVQEFSDPKGQADDATAIIFKVADEPASSPNPALLSVFVECPVQ